MQLIHQVMKSNTLGTNQEEPTFLSLRSLLSRTKAAKLGINLDHPVVFRKATIIVTFKSLESKYTTYCKVK